MILSHALCPMSAVIWLFIWAPSYSAEGSLDLAELDAREYRMRIQQAADIVVVPRLVQALSDEEQRRLGMFRVDVTGSKDSLGLSLEAQQGSSTRLVVSVGHMFVHDLLVDASLFWTLADKEVDAIDYAVDVTRFALTVRKKAVKEREPPPFWQLLGWDDKKYESLQRDPKYKQYLARARIRTFAWIVARAITMRLRNDANPTLASQSVDEEARVLSSTADLMVKARFSPTPALGSSIFLYGLQQPSRESQDEWLCSSKQVYEAAIPVAERDRATASEARKASIDDTIREWRRIAKLLDKLANCTRE